MALFDSSRDASLARRYESEASRRFFKSLKEFRQAEAEFAENPTRPAVSKPATTPTALGSSCAGGSAMPREPKPAVAEGFDRSEWVGDGMARGLDGRVLAEGRGVAVPAGAV